MLVTERTRAVREYRTAVRKWADEGFIQVAENGAPLWKFHRGAWYDKKIAEVRIAPNGIELWIKVNNGPTG